MNYTEGYTETHNGYILKIHYKHDATEGFLYSSSVFYGNRQVLAGSFTANGLNRILERMKHARA